MALQLCAPPPSLGQVEQHATPTPLSPTRESKGRVNFEVKPEITVVVCSEIEGPNEGRHPPQVDGVIVEVALQWCDHVFSDTLVGFVNSVKTVDGGTHMEGLKAALTRLVNGLARKTKALKEGDANLSGDHVREGLTAVVSVKVGVSELCCVLRVERPLTLFMGNPPPSPFKRP